MLPGWLTLMPPLVAIVLASVIGSAALQYYEEDRTADTAFHIIAGASTCNATSDDCQTLEDPTEEPTVDPTEAAETGGTAELAAASGLRYA